jgi:hypothetical protein
MKVRSLAACGLLPFGVLAQSADPKSAGPATSEALFTPVVLNAKDSSGLTLALEYKITGVLFSRSNDAPADLTSNVDIRDIQLRYKASGTLASSAAKNPKNFLEFLLEGAYLQTLPYGTASGGLMAKYETDQSLDQKQSVLGLRGTWGKLGVLGANDFVAFDANYGRVNPNGDTARSTVLGTEDPYYRWNLEFLYMLPVKAGPVKVVEFNYRYFKERNAPGAIIAAGLDAYRLSTVRLGLPKDFFIGYTSGKLPFDRTKDKTLEVGWSYKLE